MNIITLHGVPTVIEGPLNNAVKAARKLAAENPGDPVQLFQYSATFRAETTIKETREIK